MTEKDLEDFEGRCRDGVASGEIVSVLDRWGVRFSEALLRKYVQLGLLPRSVRVGRKGAHRGSEGKYPALIVRQILEIKRLLSEGYTIEQIRTEYLLLKGEIEVLERQIAAVLEGVERALAGPGDELATEHVRRELREARASAAELVGKLRAIESRMSLRKRLAKAAG